MQPTQPLTLANCSSRFKDASNIWTCEVFMRAFGYMADPSKLVGKSFSKLYLLGSGAIHGGGHKPITFIRQVTTLALNPKLLDSDRYPEDVKQRVRTLFNGDPTPMIGNYSLPLGFPNLRKQICKFIEDRDGIEAHPENIIVGDGATGVITMLMEMMSETNNGRPAGMLLPYPFFTVYVSVAAKLGIEVIPYYLDEDDNWSVSTSELERAVREAETRCHPRLFVVINPGNPTATVLSKETIQELVKFAHRERLVILADEVYQLNIYLEDVKFHSFKKVVTEMELPYSQVQVASVMCASKGYMGECGARAGYCEMLNFEKQLIDTIMPSQLSRLCPNTIGQVVMYCTVNTPQVDEPSYPLFHQERTKILTTLKTVAEMVTERLNRMKGISCVRVVSSLYGFPRLILPPKYLARAQKMKMAPDDLYCLDLLEKSGIAAISGTFFGQKPGTYHFRMTIVDQVDFMEEVLTVLENYQEKFIAEYQ